MPAAATRNDALLVPRRNRRNVSTQPRPMAVDLARRSRHSESRALSFPPSPLTDRRTISRHCQQRIRLCEPRTSRGQQRERCGLGYIPRKVAMRPSLSRHLVRRDRRAGLASRLANQPERRKRRYASW
jgi:hypothetical protein